MRHVLATFLFSTLLFTGSAQTDTTRSGSLRRGIHFAPQQSALHTYPNRFWVDVSGQVGLLRNSALGGMCAGGNLHYLNKNRRHFQVRYNFVQSLAIFSPPDHEISDIGYLAGWLHARKYSLMEFSIGISCVSGYKRGDEDYSSYWFTEYKKDPFTTIGLPFEADIKFMASRYAGLGLVIKGNLNPEASYIGTGIELTLNGPN